MKEISLRNLLPGVWGWSTFHPDKQLCLNGWYLRKGKEVVVIDPPTPGDAVLNQVAELGTPRVILLTHQHHTRATEIFRERFGATVWVPEGDKKLMEIPIDRTYRDTDTFPCGLKAISLRHGKTQGETAFLLGGEVRTLLVGGALIGRPTGSLSWPSEGRLKDEKKVRETLRALLVEDFDAVLVGNGESILRSGKTALEQFLR